MKKQLMSFLDKVTGRSYLKQQLIEKQNLLNKRDRQLIKAANKYSESQQTIDYLNNQLLQCKVEVSILKNSNNVGLQLDK